MKRTAFLAKALALSPAERILFVQDIWDSIAADPGSVALSEAQRRRSARLSDAQAPSARSSAAQIRVGRGNLCSGPL